MIQVGDKVIGKSGHPWHNVTGVVNKVLSMGVPGTFTLEVEVVNDPKQMAPKHTIVSSTTDSFELDDSAFRIGDGVELKSTVMAGAYQITGIVTGIDHFTDTVSVKYGSNTSQGPISMWNNTSLLLRLYAKMYNSVTPVISNSTPTNLTSHFVPKWSSDGLEQLSSLPIKKEDVKPKQQPCKIPTCKRMNFLDAKKCWWCLTENPCS